MANMELKTAYGFNGNNILYNAVDPDLGCVWTDGECVYLSTISDSEPEITSMHETKTLGKFSDVTGCSWSPCQTMGTHFLAVQHKTHAVIWAVESRMSVSNPEFKKLHTIEHREHGKGCVWHPNLPLIVVFTKSQVILFSIKSGKTSTVLDDGLDITAACWTLDGRHLILSNGNQLKIYGMNTESEAVTSMETTFMERNPGSVCSLMPISNHIIAIATELPLQKIVTELSSDLFSPDIAGNDFQGKDIPKTSHSVIGENRPSLPLSPSHSNLDCELKKLNANGNLETSHTKGNKVHCSSSTELDTGDNLLQSPNHRGSHGNCSTEDGKSLASRIVEEALKKKTGPIDMMDILALTKERKVGDVADTTTRNVERHMESNSTTLNSTNSDETKDRPKRMAPAMNIHQVRTSIYQAETSDEKPHYHLTKDLKSQSTNVESIPIGGSKIQFLNSRKENMSLNDSGNKMVDLTHLKSHGTFRVPQFKQTREPGANSCARLTLLDVKSKKFVSHIDLHGIITPSIIHYQPSRRVIVIASHSKRTLSLYSFNESTLQRLPQTIELGETERPAGVCSVPDIEGSILVAVTKPISDDGSFRGVLPSSQEKRLLSLKVVDLPTGQTTSAKAVDSTSSYDEGATSHPGDADDDGLQTLLLPGGLPFNANGKFLGKRLGIEVLKENNEHDDVSKDPLSGRKLDVPTKETHSCLYPTPENAAYVTLRLIRDSQVFQKCFLLQSGLLPLQPILDVFHLKQAEFNFGSRWIVLSADKEGVVPLRFNAGSSYDIREAALSNSSR
ncbi:WD repeat and coiled-coil-containing protein-like [Lytechinus variegatus]|uniref:WD repeat and coiled-coil-containing protein-like n=1 Tax=Lytechinus variegatus TaxID=7654 RepID=UPI001BB25C03|nr:WD repeat and coiled-coil-containing protein-like [Lytechinus variegatus]